MRIKTILQSYVRWNWGWNLDSALRYEKAVEIIKETKPGSILEIGSGSRGISAYAKYPSFGVDIIFNDAIPPGLQTRVKVSASELPFENRSIDFVISADILEHVSDSMRPTIVKEMFRVVKIDGMVYITVPTGKESEKADKRVNNAYKEKHGVPHPLLSDHIENGLPIREKIVNLVESELKKLDWSMIVTENMPIALWEWNLMWFGVGRYIPGLRHFQRIILQIMYPFLKSTRSNNNYRILIMAGKRGTL